MIKYNDVKMMKLKHLFPICRSITGKGTRETLKYFENYHNEYKTN